MKKLKVLMIGAHPDDPDGCGGGTALRYVARGDEVRFLSVSDGRAGHFSMAPELLAARRRKEADAVTMWSPENVSLCAARQAEILDEAAKMRRAGGYLTYSTCTFAPAENEGAVLDFLSRHPEFEVMPSEEAAVAESREKGLLDGGRPEWAEGYEQYSAELLEQIGADEVIYPEKEIAEKLAIRYNSNNIFDYIQLTSEYSIYEIPIMGSWEGKTIIEVDVRRKYHINIIAVKTEKKGLNPMPGADYVFQKDDHVVVMGKSSDVFKVAGKRKR